MILPSKPAPDALLAHLVPELSLLLSADSLPAAVEISRPEQFSSIVALRFPIADFYPGNAPTLVLTRPAADLASLSSSRMSTLASAALMVIALSIALARISHDWSFLEAASWA